MNAPPTILENQFDSPLDAHEVLRRAQPLLSALGCEEVRDDSPTSLLAERPARKPKDAIRIDLWPQTVRLITRPNPQGCVVSIAHSIHSMPGAMTRYKPYMLEAANLLEAALTDRLTLEQANPAAAQAWANVIALAARRAKRERIIKIIVMGIPAALLILLLLMAFIGALVNRHP